MCWIWLDTLHYNLILWLCSHIRFQPGQIVRDCNKFLKQVVLGCLFMKKTLFMESGKRSFLFLTDRFFTCKEILLYNMYNVNGHYHWSLMQTIILLMMNCAHIWSRRTYMRKKKAFLHSICLH